MNGPTYVFVLGPVAVVVQHWEERFSELESGARVEVRRVEPSTGERDRAGAAGFRVPPVSEGGIGDLADAVDPISLSQALPAVRAAIDTCLVR